MTADALDLARCAVACPGWRWMPGMTAIRPAVFGLDGSGVAREPSREVVVAIRSHATPPVRLADSDTAGLRLAAESISGAQVTGVWHAPPTRAYVSGGVIVDDDDAEWPSMSEVQLADKFDTNDVHFRFLRIPDLTDPATLGCLLALVREAWGMPTGITVAYSDDTGRWVVSWSGGTHGGVCGEGATEAAALVAALEAAPANTTR